MASNPFMLHSALSDILSQKFLDTQPDIDIIGVFDAHVGDCACHMRAQMIWDLITDLSSSDAIFSLCENINPRLKTLKSQTASFLHRIIKKNGNPRLLGFGPVITLADIHNAIGWSEFLDPVETDPIFPATSTPSSTTTSDTGKSSGSTPATPLSPSSPSDDLDQAIKKLLIHENGFHMTVKGASGILRSSEPSSSHHHRSLSLDTVWDPGNPMTVIRLITFARLLSISKVASHDNGPPPHIFTRIDPQYGQSVS